MTTTTTTLTYTTSFQGFTMESRDRPDPPKFVVSTNTVTADLNGPSDITVTYSEFEQLFGGMVTVDSNSVAASARLNAIKEYIKTDTVFKNNLLAKFNAASETNVQWKNITIGDTSAWFSELVTDLKNSYAGVEFIPNNSLQLVVRFTVANLGRDITLGWKLKMV